MSFYYWVVHVSLFWIQVSHQICDLKKISPILFGLYFSLHGQCSLKHKHFNFDELQLTCFSSGGFGGISKKSLPNQRSQRFKLTLSSKDIVLVLTFKSLILFNFCMCFREIQIHSSVCEYPVVSAPFIEKTTISPWFVLTPLTKISWPKTKV